MDAVLAALVLAAAQEPPPAKDAAPAWIEALAADDPDVRERAAVNLLRAGRPAWPALERARSHPDPDVRAAAEHLLRVSHRRRGMPYRILRDHPAALEILDGPASPSKARLMRSMGRSFEECGHIIAALLSDPDPETRVTAAEILLEHRRHAWVEPMLDLLAAEFCPRAGRVAELLASAASRLPRDRFERLLDEAGPGGRTRLVELAASANLAVEIPRPLLHRMLREGTPREVRAALGWIRLRPLPEHVAPVQDLLSSADDGVLAEALGTLRTLGAWTDPARVRPLLSHESAAVRAETLELLDSLGNPFLGESVLAFLDDPSTAVRRTAFLILWKRHGPGALERTLRIYFEQDGDPRELAASYLLRYRGWVHPRILEDRESSDPERRLRSLELLHAMDGLPALEVAAVDREPEIRRWALARLLSQEGSGAFSAVDALAGDSDESVRFDALRGLVRRGRLDRCEELAKFLAHREYAFAQGAAETLLDCAGERAPEFARRILRGDDPNLRRMAIESLGERRSFDATAEAVDCLADPDPRLQRAAVHYLAQALAAKGAPDIVPALRERVSTLGAEAAEPALLLVAATGDSGSLRAVRDALVSGRLVAPDRALRSLSEHAEGGILLLLGDDAALNDRVFRALATRGADRAGVSDRLPALARHADPQVRAGAVRAAAELRIAEPETLALPALEDSDPEVRHAAATVCGERRIESAASALSRLLDDEDPDVRVAAAWALSRVSAASRPLVEAAAAAEEHEWVRRRMEAVLREGK